MDANERMPGDREAAAAIAGLAEVYGRDLAVGDWITFRREWWPSGRTASGRVQQVGDHGWLVQVEGDVAYVKRSELVAL
jgi:hypothetical protein